VPLPEDDRRHTHTHTLKLKIEARRQEAIMTDLLKINKNKNLYELQSPKGV
jgi:hypothetical protein